MDDHAFYRYPEKRKFSKAPPVDTSHTKSVLWTVLAGLALLSTYHIWALHSMCTARIESLCAKDAVIAASAACNEHYPIYSERLDCPLIRQSLDPREQRASINQCWREQLNPFQSWSAIAVLVGSVLTGLKLALSYRLSAQRNERHLARDQVWLRALEQREPSPRRPPPYIAYEQQHGVRIEPIS
jgi:hypothetical protein